MAISNYMHIIKEIDFQEVLSIHLTVNMHLITTVHELPLCMDV